MRLHAMLVLAISRYLRLSGAPSRLENDYFDQVNEASEFLKHRLSGLAPRICIVLGSGLVAVAEAVESPDIR